MHTIKEKLDGLLGQYWDIAHSEGSTGISRGDEAGAVLSAIQGLLDQPEGQPVAWECDAGIGLIRYVTDKKYKKFTPSIQRHYKPYAPFTPITADMVTESMIHEWHAKVFSYRGSDDKSMIAAAVNAFMPTYMGAKK